MPKVIELQQQLETQTAEFAAERAKLTADLAAERINNSQRAFFSAEEMKRKISPAVEIRMLAIMEFMAGTESYEFSAPDPADETKTIKVKQAPVELFKEFCRTCLPDIITFEELATKKKATGGNKTDMTNAQDIAAKAIEFQNAEKDAGRVITITEAVNHVTKQ
jgi:hypothetical protein